MSLSSRQEKAFWGRERKTKLAAQPRSPADIFQRRRRLGGCRGNGAAQAVRRRRAPAAGLDPSHKRSVAQRGRRSHLPREGRKGTAAPLPTGFL